MAEKSSTIKYCPKCKQTKSVNDFHRCHTRADGRVGYCRSCFKQKYLLRYEKERSRILAWSKEYGRTKRYGITQEQYNALVEKQQNRCAICETLNPGRNDSRLNIDHDHKTNKVRGLLCHNCNKGLGNFFDNTLLLSKAIDYLKGENYACLSNR